MESQRKEKKNIKEKKKKKKKRKSLMVGIAVIIPTVGGYNFPGTNHIKRACIVSNLDIADGKSMYQPMSLLELLKKFDPDRS